MLSVFQCVSDPWRDFRKWRSVDEHVGQTLKALRKGCGLTSRELAQAVHVSRTQLANLEAGRRSLRLDLAHRLDQVLGTSLLSTLVNPEGDDDVNRRNLIAALGAAAGTAGALTPAVLAETTRLALTHADANPAHDWDATVAAYTTKLATDPSATFGRDLLADLTTVTAGLRQDKPTRDLVRAGAGLALLYGIFAADVTADLRAARGWYATAGTLSDRSGHPGTQALIRGRVASRMPYEGKSAAASLATASKALQLATTPCAGQIEAYSAQVHVHALTGQLEAGRAAVNGMRRIADLLPDADAPGGAYRRAASFASYLENRLGSAQAAATFEIADEILADTPVWHADARVYRARAMVLGGDVAGGVSFGLDAVRSLGHRLTVLGLGVADLIAAVPTGYSSDDLTELRGYASAGPLPWEYLRA